MILSDDRMRTTHVGSLPRNDVLSELLVRREEGEPVDSKVLGEEMDRAVLHVVEKQAQAGIDIGNDGEQQRVGFQTYVAHRMSGFGGESKRRRGRDSGYGHHPARDRSGAARSEGYRRFCRVLHYGALAGHRFDDHAQCLLPVA
jgi:methionine synthase II (cobalamin-independent)